MSTAWVLKQHKQCVADKAELCAKFDAQQKQFADLKLQLESQAKLIDEFIDNQKKFIDEGRARMEVFDNDLSETEQRLVTRIEVLESPEQAENTKPAEPNNSGYKSWSQRKKEREAQLFDPEKVIAASKPKPE